MELLAVTGLALLAWDNRTTATLTRIEKVLLCCLVAVPLIQLVPIPGLSRLSLPGQADYFTALTLAGADQTTTLSVLPRETLLGWLVLLIPVSVFLLTRALPAKKLQIVLAIVLGMAAFQAVLGLVQYGTGPDGPFSFGVGNSGGLAKGTWRGRNNYAGFLYGTLVISIALFIATLGRHKKMAGHESLRDRLVFFSTLQGHKAFLYGALSLLLIVAIVFSRSRAGISLTMLGVVLTSLALSRRIGGENVYGLTGTILAGAIGVGIAIGLGPVLERFSQSDPLSDGRWTIFEGAFEGIGQFFPLGSGGGTFEQVYPAFQALRFSAYTINQAHNSYLEWLFTAGIFGLALIVALVAMYALRWLSVWKRGTWGDFRYIQVGAGLAILLTLLHEGVDFNLFVPANLVYFAFFAGLFFHHHQEPAPARRSVKVSSEPPERSRTLLQPVSTEPARNPFMDDD